MKSSTKTDDEIWVAAVSVSFRTLNDSIIKILASELRDMGVIKLRHPIIIVAFTVNKIIKAMIKSNIILNSTENDTDIFYWFEEGTSGKFISLKRLKVNKKTIGENNVKYSWVSNEK